MSEKTSAGTVHAHNLIEKDANPDARYGLRLTLPADDTFASILGPDWKKERWYHSEAERDIAIQDLRRQHPYYRLGDKPTIEIVKINRAN